MASAAGEFAEEERAAGIGDEVALDFLDAAEVGRDEVRVDLAGWLARRFHRRGVAQGIEAGVDFGRDGAGHGALEAARGLDLLGRVFVVEVFDDGEAVMDAGIAVDRNGTRPLGDFLRRAFCWPSPESITSSSSNGIPKCLRTSQARIDQLE